MTKVGMTYYQRQGVPRFKTIVENTQPKFILANHPALLGAVTGNIDKLHPLFKLFDEDVSVLKNNYIHHWENIYVAGKKIYLTGQDEQSFEIKIEGPYTIESNSSVRINGRRYNAGDIIRLKPGKYKAGGYLSEQILVLRWGKMLYQPAGKLNMELFRPFS